MGDIWDNIQGEQLVEATRSAINKLCKWRTVLAGRWLGTMSKDNAEAIAVRDIQDARLLLRVETSALTRILIDKGICTEEEFTRAVGREAVAYDAMYERYFPGFQSSDDGMVIYDSKLAAQTQKGWKP